MPNVLEKVDELTVQLDSWDFGFIIDYVLPDLAPVQLVIFEVRFGGLDQSELDCPAVPHECEISVVAVDEV